MTEKELQEGIDWMRARPASLHDVMIKFPPSCKVRALRPLHTPGPGKIGQIVSYVENKDEPPTVRVVEVPDGNIAGECQQDWLEVVEYYENITPEFVRMVLGK